MEKLEDKTIVTNTAFGCTDCGADLKYKPGTTYLNCEYCGAENQILHLDTKIEAFDFEEYIAKEAQLKTANKACFIKCRTCGASSNLPPNIVSASCPYCTTPLLLEQAQEEEVLQPNSLLPFEIDSKEAKHKFKEWIGSLWFVPNTFKKATLKFKHFNGVYIPFWIYNAYANTQYIGQQGNYYYKTESYKALEDGKKVTKTRQVKKTKWHSVKGMVTNFFEDRLKVATNSIPEKYINELDFWDLDALMPYNKNYISGFITEKYQIGLAESFELLQADFEPEINNTIRKDIGGDTQRVVSKQIKYTNVKFKHVLLPVYVCAYHYKGKVYQFLINGSTGDVQGKRPYSWLKITLASFVALIIITIISITVYHYTK
ncbi:DNA helicase PriA [Aquimarina algiphila]|uniref:DNA helicase PriA n=1 Tax=Aquimarina algiphila TaxID=2047982 RepID=UPI002330E062|nr:DNA helicase PriA [Aquimarina algiphila]